MSDREPLAPFVSAFLGIPGIVLGDALNFREVECNCGDPGCAGVRVIAHFDAHILNGALVWKRGDPDPKRVELAPAAALDALRRITGKG